MDGGEGGLRGDILWEPLPHEDDNEQRPEEPNALLLSEYPFASMQGVEELDSR